MGKENNEAEDDDDEDFGLNNPRDYALRTWYDYNEHGLLPEAGGINDQDPLWYDDIHTLNLRYSTIARRLSGNNRDIFSGLKRTPNPFNFEE